MSARSNSHIKHPKLDKLEFSDNFERNKQSVEACVQGYEINASSILEKSVDARWYEYMGKPVDISFKDRVLTVKAGDAFGLKEEGIGYSLETDVVNQGPVFVSVQDGYVLSRMSRQLSRREQKSRQTKY